MEKSLCSRLSARLSILREFNFRGEEILASAFAGFLHSSLPRILLQNRMDKERQAVIVGVGRYTQSQRVEVKDCKTPVGMQVEAAMRAARDAGFTGREHRLLNDIVAVGTPGMFLEQRWFGEFKQMPFKSFSGSVAQALGAKPHPWHLFRAYPGGNSPQYFVSHFAEMLSKGELPQGPILIGGVEENSAFDRAVRSGQKDTLVQNGWADTPKDIAKLTEPVMINTLQQPPSEGPYRSILASQFYHTGNPPALYLYPLFENAYAHSLGRTAEEHLPYIADLFSRFSVVAAVQAEHSWYPYERTKEWLMEPTKENYIIGYPYRKWMCARDEVDQSSAVLLMSWAEALRRGISENNLVFLHGSGDAVDENILALRYRLDKSPSMQVAYDEAFRSAGLGEHADETKVALFDIYSCFPIAVEHACDCVGMDPRIADVSRMTQTGGLPYHGGPGSNYSGHGLCALVEKLRLDRFRGTYGVLGANGGWLTEHSVGVYSTKPPSRTYMRRDMSEYKDEYAFSLEKFAWAPNGIAKIITWTVRFKRKLNEPEIGIIVGEMLDDGKRFCANTKKGDMRSCQWLLGKDRIGESVLVYTDTSQKVTFGKRFFHVVTFEALPHPGKKVPRSKV